MRFGFDGHVLDGREQGTKTVFLRFLDLAPKLYPQHEFLVYSEHPHPSLDFTLPNLHHRPTRHEGVAKYLLATMPRVNAEDRLDALVFNFIQSPRVRNAAVILHDILPQTHPRYFSPLFVARCWWFFGMSTVLARALFTDSEASRGAIRRCYPWTARRPIDVLHLGPSFPASVYEAGAAGALPERVRGVGRYALSVGRIEPRKNIQLAIDAFHAGAPADARYLIVGRREPGLALNLHGDDRIVELGGVEEAELIALYQSAALFLYPSIAEGFGLPLLDAIRFGVPVLSSQLTSMAEIGAGCAEFFDPTAPGAGEWLAARIAGHFGDSPVPTPSLEQRAAKAQEFSWERATHELIAGMEATAR